MNEVQATTPLDWRQALEQGRVHEALTLYLRNERQDARVLGALEALTDLRSHLRAKRWVKAQQIAAAQVQDAAADAGLTGFDWQALQAQIGLLQEGAKVLDRRDPDKALVLLEDVEHPVLQAEVETLRGTAFIFMQELTKASACFAHALSYDPKHYRAMTNQGNLALEAGRVDEAIAAYEKALAINEDFSNAHHNLGVAYRKKGDIGRSVASIRKAQRALRQEESERVKSDLSGRTQGGFRKVSRWVVYGALIMLVFWWLQGQGII